MSEKKDVKKPVELNEENVIDSIKKGNVFQEEHVKAAIEQIQKGKDEKKKNEAVELICRADYANKKELLHLRARRREERITKEILTRTATLKDEVLAGKHTLREFEILKSKLNEEKKKRYDESDRIYQEELRELKNSYEAGYAYYWD